MFRIIYTSRASRAFDRAEMRQLCDLSTKRNTEDDVTGLFLYDGIRFLQALEGKQSVVEAAMSRIENDERHYDIVFMHKAAIDAREFPSWSMDTPLNPDDVAEEFVEKVKADVSAVTDPSMRAMFIGLAKLAATSRNRA